MPVALLLTPAVSSSGGNLSAGRRSRPVRSRTVLLYSARVRRRSGAGAGSDVTQSAPPDDPMGPVGAVGPTGPAPVPPVPGPPVPGFAPEHAPSKVRDSAHATLEWGMATSDREDRGQART